MKRTLCLLLVLMMTVMCTTITATAEEEIVITMAGMDAESNYAGMIKVIEEMVPGVKIEYQFISSSSYHDMMYTQLAAGMGPDIVQLDRPMIAAGYIADISEMAYFKDIEPSSLEIFTMDGKVYGLPLGNWFEGIFYNKAIFREYNLQVPTTWAEYLNVHQVLADNGVKPQVMGAQSWEPLMKSSFGFLLCEFYAENAGFDQKLVAGEASVAESWLAPLQTWQQLMENGYLTSTMLGLSYDQALDEFATGKAAMWESGPWALSTILEKNPDIELGMFPFVGQNGQQWLVGGVSACFGVNAGSANLEAALKVMEAMGSDEALLAKCAATEGSTAYKRGLTYDMPAIYDDCAEVFSNANIYCPWDHWGDLDGQSLIIEIGNQYQAVLGGATSLEDALQAIDYKIEDLRTLME